METITITLSVITAVVIGAVQLAKQAGLPTRWCPLLAVALGVSSTVGLTGFSFAPEIIFTGVVVGLTSVGLFSGARATAGK